MTVCALPRLHGQGGLGIMLLLPIVIQPAGRFLSTEIDIYHPIKKQWVELGGAGIFRPEVTIPLMGKEVPVLAWGLGLERSIMEYYKITDIRDIYRNDLKQLREAKLWLK